MDAVFSIGVKYASVLKVVGSVCKHSKVQQYRKYGSSFPNIADQYAVSTFNDAYGELRPKLLAGSDILKNTQRASSKNGILKAEAVQRWMKVLEEHKINTFQDLQRKFEKQVNEGLDNVRLDSLDEFENSILVNSGQKSGISRDFF